jgi:SPP1 gp7 family putative phage head morphogenesis protein
LNKAEKAVEQIKLDREKAVLDALTEHFEHALNGINERLQVLQSRPETQSTVYRVEYQKMMQKQVAAIVENLHANVYQSIDDYMHDAYTTGFVGTMYDLHYQSIPIIVPINRDAVLRAVQHDTKLTSPLYEVLGIDAKKMSRKISKELSRGLASGLTYDEIARNIRRTTKAPLARAKVIARTEGHRIHEQSSHDAAVAAKGKGADLVKQWDSILDGDTRHNHRLLDGQIRELDEPYEVGSYKPMHPGDFGTASEDCNCRCVSKKRARAALDAGELAKLKKRAEFFGLDKSEQFADFEKKYLKAVEENE